MGAAKLNVVRNSTPIPGSVSLYQRQRGLEFRGNKHIAEGASSITKSAQRYNLVNNISNYIPLTVNKTSGSILKLILFLDLRTFCSKSIPI